MMRSLFSGVSGLKAHQTKMDVIGNNIANVNTTAYKTMSINFSDLMYQTTKTASGPNAETGTAGTNPRQIGLGVQTAAISTKITEPGATQSTGNPFDLKITGDEFFVVSDGTSTFFTRDGSFYVDAAGNLAMSSTGYNVMGWLPDGDTGTIKKDTVQPLTVMSEENMTYPAEWTQAAYASGVVDYNDANQKTPAGKTMNLQIYDNLGYSYTVKASLHNAHHEDGGDYSFYVVIDDILDANGKTILTTQARKDAVKFGEAGNVRVDEKYGLNSGTLTTTSSTEAYVSFTYNGATVSVMLQDGTNTDTLFSTAGTVNNTVLLSDGTTAPGTDIFAALYGTSIEPTAIRGGTLDLNTGAINVTEKYVDKGSVLTYSGKDGSFVSASGGTDPKNTTLDLSALGEAFTAISIDFSKTLVSDAKGTSTIGIEKGTTGGLQKGRALGSLEGVSIQSNGMIYASYSNNQTKLLGQIACAEFANPSGLSKEGDNLYQATLNSGEFDGIGVDLTTNGDYMTTGVLEMSNVDLSAEFTEMITTQRGFQANSRIITVSDTLLEELVNLKR